MHAVILYAYLKEFFCIFAKLEEALVNYFREAVAKIGISKVTSCKSLNVFVCVCVFLYQCLYVYVFL